MFSFCMQYVCKLSIYANLRLPRTIQNYINSHKAMLLNWPECNSRFPENSIGKYIFIDAL